MLVKLRRNWYGPDGVRYKARLGLAEIPESLKDQLPSDAVVLSEDGTLPSRGTPAMPGFGAKPAHEQVLDQIPYAAPTHQITTGGGEQPGDGLHPPKEPVKPVTLETQAEVIEERYEKQLEAHEKAVKDQKPAVEEARKAVAEGLAEAKEMEDAKAEASGDKTRASQIKTSSAPVKDEPKKDEAKASKI